MNEITTGGATVRTQSVSRALDSRDAEEERLDRRLRWAQLIASSTAVIVRLSDLVSRWLR